MQLPTYDGTKSYQNLLVGVYGGVDSNGELLESHLDAVIHNKPLNSVRGGYYERSNGGINVRNGRGYYWRLDSSSDNSAGHLLAYSTYFNSQNAHFKGHGMALRCLVR